MIKVAKAGEPTPRATKRELESIAYTLDFTDILESKELIASVRAVSDVQVIDVNPLLGKMVSFRVPPSNDSKAMEYIDSTIQLLVQTSLGNTRVGSVVIRIYK
jgi:hypothetical protein